MQPQSVVLRLVAVLLGLVGTSLLAFAAVLAFMWVMDQSGPTGSLDILLAGLTLGVLGSVLLILRRKANAVARQSPQVEPIEGAV